GVGVSQAIGVGGRDLSAEVGGVMTLRALELLAEDPTTEVIVLVSKPPDARVAERVEAAVARIEKPVVTALLGPGSTLEAAVGRSAALPEAPAPVQPKPGFVRGLFSGGTLCTEAMLVAAQASGTAVNFIDFGGEEFTESRPHPMIDLTLRLERFEQEAADP